jgi:hypothetical protein
LTSKVGPASFLVPLIALVNETSGNDASVFGGAGRSGKLQGAMMGLTEGAEMTIRGFGDQLLHTL